MFLLGMDMFLVQLREGNSNLECSLMQLFRPNLERLLLLKASNLQSLTCLLEHCKFLESMEQEKYFQVDNSILLGI